MIGADFTRSWKSNWVSIPVNRSFCGSTTISNIDRNDGIELKWDERCQVIGFEKLKAKCEDE